MRRIVFFIYGLACYILFLGVFVYAIGFIGNFAVPKSLDSAPTAPVSTAITVNCLLLGLFAVQHSVMARPTFKRWWTQFVPKPIERSTYVLLSNVAMITLFLFWQPLGGNVWNVESEVRRSVMYTLYAAGWLTVLYATCLRNHFDLFGLRQVTLQLQNKLYIQLPFKKPSLYRFVRHPLYVGWLMVFWFTPTMTFSHFFFAVGTTSYILIAIQLEERNLADSLPEYEEYKKDVPMLLPSFSKSSLSETTV